jgi:uncharacterized membrane protein (DUF4010 family)
MEELDILGRMAAALGIGVLIGLERGWSTRELAEGHRVAGVRTFGLVSLAGAMAALLAETMGGVVLGLGFVAVIIIMLFGRYLNVAETKDIGVTTIVAALLTFALGAVAMVGHLGLAVSAGVLAALLLSVKAELHSAIRRIDRQELLAALKLLIMSVVLLPVLPNRGFGPWQALNPFEIWTMVVLICLLSFAGYVGIKLLGDRKGITLAALAGALVSSTAVTITLSRLPDKNRTQVGLVGGAIVLASAIMCARTLVVVAVFGLSLLPGLAIPLGLACVSGLIVGAAFIRSAGAGPAQHGFSLRNPFDFWMAAKFGLVLAVVIVLAQALKEWAGDPGVYLVAGVSGFVDVDAATLSLARMAPDQIPIEVGVGAVLLASVANTLFKAAIAVVNSRAGLLKPIVIGIGSQLLVLALGAFAVFEYVAGPG